jgi:hypothetical protein
MMLPSTPHRYHYGLESVPNLGAVVAGTPNMPSSAAGAVPTPPVPGAPKLAVGSAEPKPPPACAAPPKLRVAWTVPKPPPPVASPKLPALNGELVELVGINSVSTLPAATAGSEKKGNPLALGALADVAIVVVFFALVALASNATFAVATAASTAAPIEDVRRRLLGERPPPLPPDKAAAFFNKPPMLVPPLDTDFCSVWYGVSRRLPRSEVERGRPIGPTSPASVGEGVATGKPAAWWRYSCMHTDKSTADPAAVLASSCFTCAMNAALRAPCPPRLCGSGCGGCTGGDGGWEAPNADAAS